MISVTGYTTEELKRLITLQAPTTLAGEFVLAIQPSNAKVFLRTDALQFVSETGATHLMENMSGGRRRRVHSFTDRTEIDPSQEVMLVELTRREDRAKFEAEFPIGRKVMWNEMEAVIASNKGPLGPRSLIIDIKNNPQCARVTTIDTSAVTEFKPLRFKKGDVVVRAIEDGRGHLGRVLRDVEKSDNGAAVTNDWLTWDQRVLSLTAYDTLTWSPMLFTLATPSDIAAYEARIPKSFKVGDLVVTTAGSEVLPILGFDHGNVRLSRSGFAGNGTYNPSTLRLATDAEVAAYHKAHCVTPAKVVVSNKEHAGRKARTYDGRDAIVLTAWSAATLLPAHRKDGAVRAIRTVGIVVPSSGATSFYAPHELELL
jgi:hypothetical protein